MEPLNHIAIEPPKEAFLNHLQRLKIPPYVSNVASRLSKPLKEKRKSSAQMSAAKAGGMHTSI